MKNHNKASLPKIQIKQVQILNRSINSQTVKNVNAAVNYPTTDTMTTSTGF
ncbi:hypothetical protein [Mucilaginibacter kameinonensis]|uniref:hypothetical protein n=1 Tax=Mucilaginibacter kameinonensis TaxID=452286 RepID=UPI0013CF02D8|nr:hypothetical protein [Mucilaginibacter kameinonensis]